MLPSRIELRAEAISEDSSGDNWGLALGICSDEDVLSIMRLGFREHGKVWEWSVIEYMKNMWFNSDNQSEELPRNTSSTRN